MMLSSRTTVIRGQIPNRRTQGPGCRSLIAPRSLDPITLSSAGSSLSPCLANSQTYHRTASQRPFSLGRLCTHDEQCAMSSLRRRAARQRLSLAAPRASAATIFWMPVTLHSRFVDRRSLTADGNNPAMAQGSACDRQTVGTHHLSPCS